MKRKSLLFELLRCSVLLLIPAILFYSVFYLGKQLYIKANDAYVNHLKNDLANQFKDKSLNDIKIYIENDLDIKKYGEHEIEDVSSDCIRLKFLKNDLDPYAFFEIYVINGEVDITSIPIDNQFRPRFVLIPRIQ